MTIGPVPTSIGQSDGAEPTANPDVTALPLAPKNPLPYRQQLSCLRAFHTGVQTLRDAGGPVTRLALAPKWLMPPIVIATSPQGGRDILGRSDAVMERTVVHHEVLRRGVRRVGTSLAQLGARTNH
jgi:hypothetical protein